LTGPTTGPRTTPGPTHGLERQPRYHSTNASLAGSTGDSLFFTLTHVPKHFSTMAHHCGVDYQLEGIRALFERIQTAQSREEYEQVILALLVLQYDYRQSFVCRIVRRGKVLHNSGAGADTGLDLKLVQLAGRSLKPFLDQQKRAPDVTRLRISRRFHQ